MAPIPVHLNIFILSISQQIVVRNAALVWAHPGVLRLCNDDIDNDDDYNCALRQTNQVGTLLDYVLRLQWVSSGQIASPSFLLINNSGSVFWVRRTQAVTEGKVCL